MIDIKGIDGSWEDLTREERMAWEGAASAAIDEYLKTSVKRASKPKQLA